MLGPNHILITLRWGDGCSSGHENVCWWFLKKPTNHVLWNINFQNWSKALCSGVSKPIKRLAAQSTAYAVRKRIHKCKKGGSFSILKCIKAYVRSTVGNNWLQALILVHAYKNILDNINLADVKSEFAYRKDIGNRPFRHFFQNYS